MCRGIDSFLDLKEHSSQIKTSQNCQATDVMLQAEAEGVEISCLV